MNADDFNLKHEIKAVIRDTDLASPHEISAKVVENIPVKLLREALSQALPDLVRIELGRDRNGGSAVAAPQANRSAKVGAIRRAADAWRRALRERVHVGNGRWLLLAECSANNFRFAAEERRINAARSLASADRYERLGVACEQHHVVRAADLPEDVLAELLGEDEEAA